VDLDLEAAFGELMGGGHSGDPAAEHQDAFWHGATVSRARGRPNYASTLDISAQ
jgi:hypothetical protein